MRNLAYEVNWRVNVTPQLVPSVTPRFPSFSSLEGYWSLKFLSGMHKIKKTNNFVSSTVNYATEQSSGLLVFRHSLRIFFRSASGFSTGSEQA